MIKINALLEFYKEDSRDSFVLYSLAQEYSSIGNMSESRKYYHLLEDVDPDYIGLYYHLGKLEESEGNYDSARKVYIKGIETAHRLGETHALSELEGALALLKMLMDD